MTKETIEQEALSDIGEIVYRHLSGNYLIGSMGKKLLTEEIEAYIKGRTQQKEEQPLQEGGGCITQEMSEQYDRLRRNEIDRLEKILGLNQQTQDIEAEKRQSESELLPCGCDNSGDPIKFNPFNKVVQCHKCGSQYSPQASEWKKVGELANEIQKIVRNEKPTSNRER